jgi:hypothetical protein
MKNLIVGGAIAATLLGAVTTANAQTRYRDQHGTWNAPVAMHYRQQEYRRVGPPWAGPNQCFTDEGYGRYQSCDAGR